MYFTNLEVTVF